MTTRTRPGRRLRSVSRCGAVLGGLAVLVAPQAQADSTSALTDLVDAAAQRLQIAEPVAVFKWNTHGAIEDPGRVQQELAKLGADASADHVDPDYVTRVFGDQINATEAIEYTRFGDWKLNPEAVPAASPDLAASRSAIDSLNQTMLNQVMANWGLLHSPACAVQLDIARTDVAQTRQLDGLYQRALSVATRSYCQQ
ncbi:MAG TPA: chorismate mutase [Mycobacterium sp.]|nr:chorismate mutase [Mycobacterium sp.]HTX95509.1 chorismate mutase [Mycobacterium sp.]